ncbi:MAG TPA: class I SAM-dependent methyltransferase [Chthoniobacterales bacterium]|jgi:SAM-dependent methyltransferase|nr:class I SAM-dependent methyltransferase [Chthoniobacterales bacterium]
MSPDNFIHVPVVRWNMDRWIVRQSILRVIKRTLPQLNGALLDIGCGKMPYRSFILENSGVTTYSGLDLEGALVYEEGFRPDVTWDGRRMPLDDASFDCALATEVFEHTPDIALLLAEIRRVLKPGGLLCFTTPFLWPYHEAPHDSQRWTSFGLERVLAAAGFTSIEVRSIGNWHSSLAQFLGLWAARAPLPRFVRAGLRYPIFALQKFLMRYDGDSEPCEAAMPRMLGGTARA